MNASAPKRPRRRVAALAAFVVIIGSVLAIEGLLRLAATRGMVRIQDYQTVSSPSQSRFLADLSPHFGVWHVPSTTVEIRTPDGIVTYETNEFGMRDRPRSIKSTATERVVVLGDSFVEGFMVEESVRLTDVLEDYTGVEFLNFGSSGGFGPIQEWLLYEHLAQRFDHTRVAVFFLPDNDFADMDPARNPINRYRPYLQREAEGFSVTYPISFERAGDRLRMSTWTRSLHTFYNISYTANLVAQLDPVSLLSRMRRTHLSKTITASYDHYSREDFERLTYSIDQIYRLAGERPLTIYIIPRERDFLAEQTGQLEQRISIDLATYAASRNLAVVDMMPGFLRYMREHRVSHSAFFLGFDPHWSALGHRVAADIVLATQPFVRNRALRSSSE